MTSIRIKPIEYDCIVYDCVLRARNTNQFKKKSHLKCFTLLLFNSGFNTTQWMILDLTICMNEHSWTSSSISLLFTYPARNHF